MKTGEYIIELPRNKQKVKLQYILQTLRPTKQCPLVSENIPISQKQLLKS